MIIQMMDQTKLRGNTKKAMKILNILNLLVSVNKGKGNALNNAKILITTTTFEICCNS